MHRVNSATERINIQPFPSFNLLSSRFLGEKKMRLSGPSTGEKHYLFFFCSRSRRDFPAMIVRPASTFTISHPPTLSFQISFSPSIFPHSPRSLLSMTREIKIPRQGRTAFEGKLLAMAGVQSANSRDACGNYIRSARHPEKKDGSRVVAEKEICPMSGDIFFRICFIIKEKFVPLIVY